MSKAYIDVMKEVRQAARVATSESSDGIGELGVSRRGLKWTAGAMSVSDGGVGLYR